MIHSIDYLLQDISTNGSVYDEFTPESYLAAEQLNKLTDYFEDSDRLRTTKLHGVGIVCGFQYSVIKNTSGQLDTIEVTPGVAITTDGDLLHTDLKALSSYIPFSNKADYDRLKMNDGKIVELREKPAAESLKEDLLPGELPLAGLKNWNDYKLVVYLEHYKVDPGLCSATSCNDTGNHVHMDQKFLLVSKDIWENTLMKSDTIFLEHNVWEFYDALPSLAVNRAVLKPNASNTTLQVYNIFKNEIDKIRNSKQLEQAYLKILDRFDRRIDFVRHGITKAAVSNSFKNLFDKLDRNLDIQYRYDAMRELIETYTEIKSLILHLNTDCNPVVEAFPKHVSLGPLNNPNHEAYRHRMYYSSLHKDKKDNLRIFKSSMIRFWQQLNTYSFTQNQPIRITSSRDFDSSLGERALPYYYKYSTTHKHWNQSFLNNRIAQQTHSYHRLGNNSQVFFPNQTSHLDKNFYRIEGHIGMPHDKALAEITKQRDDAGLAFDIKSVSIHANTKGINWDDYKCHFRDLHSMLNSWQTDFKCLVKGFEEFFGNMPTDGSKIIGQNLHKQQTLSLLRDEQKETEAKKSEGGIHTNTGAAEGLSINTNVQPKTIKEEVKLQLQTNELNCNLAGKALAGYQTQNLAQQEYHLAVLLPTQLYVHALMLGKERSWSDFLTDADYLSEVHATIKAFCSDTNNFKQVMTNYIESLRKNSQTYAAQLSSTASTQMAIFELINIYNRMKEACCYTSKLVWLKSEIERRKRDIMLELVLSNFVKKHSGAEHAAGVGKGETFVMVYAGVEEKSNPFGSTAQRVVADFTLPYLCATECSATQIVVLPPADKPTEDPKYKITNKETDICEDQEFNIKVEPEKQNESDFIAYKTAFDNKPVPFEVGQPLVFKNLVTWETEVRSQEVSFFINNKEQDYKLRVHKKIELDFEVVLKDKAYFFINKSEEACDGKLFIQTETETKQDEPIPYNEKVQIQLKETKRVTIYCESKFCRSEWGVTLSPPTGEKEPIELNFAVEHLDSPLVEIINENDMPLSDKGYAMFVNNKQVDMKLNANNQLFLSVTKPTPVKITYETSKVIGVWNKTIQPAEQQKKIVEIGFDPKRLGTGTIYEIANGTNIPLSDKGFTLFVGGKRQTIKLNTKGQLMLDIKKPTVVKITFEDDKQIGSWQQTIGATLADTHKKSREVLLVESKKSLSTIEAALKKQRPRSAAEIKLHKATTSQLNVIKKAMDSPATLSKIATRLANPRTFNSLDKIPVAQQKAAMPYVETNMLAYFNLLSTMDDASFKKAVGPSEKGHLAYVKKHSNLFTAEFKKQLAALEYASEKAKEYANGILANMK